MADLPIPLRVTCFADVLTLPAVPVDDWQLLPTDPGLYFAIIDMREVAYVGMSQRNLRGRWMGHERCQELKALGAVSVAYVPWPDSPELWQAERDAIQALDPNLNTQFSPTAQRRVNVFEPPSGETMMTLEGAAEYLGVSHMGVYRYIRTKQLARRLFGRELVLYKSELEALVRRRPGRPKRTPADPTATG